MMLNLYESYGNKEYSSSSWGTYLIDEGEALKFINPINGKKIIKSNVDDMKFSGKWIGLVIGNEIKFYKSSLSEVITSFKYEMKHNNHFFITQKGEGALFYISEERKIFSIDGKNVSAFVDVKEGREVQGLGTHFYYFISNKKLFAVSYEDEGTLHEVKDLRHLMTTASPFIIFSTPSGNDLISFDEDNKLAILYSPREMRTICYCREFK